MESNIRGLFLPMQLHRLRTFDMLHFVDPNTRIINVHRKEFVKTYKETVFTLLDRYRFEKKDEKSYEMLQREIEELTLNYSEESLYKACPNIMEMLTKTEMPSAKEYLRGKYLTDKTGRMTIYAKKLSSADVKNLRFVLSDSDQSLLKEFGEHTLECLLVHTLGQLFNLDNSVSLAGLVERIESNVRVYASFLRDNSMVNKPKDAAEEAVDDTKAKTKAYPFGTALVEFLVTRDLLRLKTYNEDELNVLDGGIPKVKRVVKKGKGYYRNSFVYAECLFNTALLPIKLSLPMVFPPKDWEPRLPEHDRMWLYISDIYGGYLSNPTGQIYSTQRCMSTPHAKNFFIYFGQNKDSKSHEKLKRLCTSISSLQRQAFKINSPLLNCIINHRALFEDYGFLMPEFLSKAILPRATGILRRHFNKNRDIESIYTFNDVCSLLMRNMQQARYECTILDLAKAYNGYSFYFPAFLDFRGRIYRSGIFHFHERDLARSLLLFDCKKGSQLTSNNDKELFQIYVTATRFHYQSYNNEFEALSDANDSIGYLRVPSEWDSEVDYIKALLSDSQKAKHPFQYFSNMHLFLMRLPAGHRFPPLSISEHLCQAMGKKSAASSRKRSKGIHKHLELEGSSVGKEANSFYAGQRLVSLFLHPGKKGSPI
ncbi:uncharacterized protein LOC113862290 [Abrus precatorius]|uniref:Uncharacterized protein LOC113862290 n=1 Tax=Abrus precatorius TaxID=3816 RepID=A0A8B8L8W3_ABRPR|nr:uncharacterized protein LOC113862290 [Abrus precatorius]